MAKPDDNPPLAPAERPVKPGIWLRVLGAIGLAFGLSIAIPGIQLITLGGSWFYLIAGAATIVAGWLIWRGDVRGVLVYLGVVVIALLWSLAEVWRMNQWFWPLIPRLFAFAFALFFILLAVPQFPRVHGRRAIVRSSRIAAVAVAVGLVLTIGGMFRPHGIIREDIAPNERARPMAASAQLNNEWPNYSGTRLGNRFQPADQITRSNVQDLELAWVYRTGRRGYDSNGDQNTPVFADNTVFACTYDNQVHAIDATTGKRKWMFDPQANAPFFMRCRGVTFYRAANGNGDGECATRIIMNTIDTRLFALDAKTGRRCASFGDNGMVDMKRGIGPFKWGMYGFTSAPMVVKDTIIVGSYLNDNISTFQPSGVIRALDAMTGGLRWAFDVGRPDEKGWPKEGETFTKGTPNMWTHAAADEELGLVYLPLGSATPDAYGGARRSFDNDYGAAVVALDIETGDERWKFQTVHKDVWDFDLPAQPSLYDVTDPTTGAPVKAIIIPTKRQDIFLLNRETGQPIAPIREKPVTTDGGIPEHAGWLSPTQPYSTGMPKIAGNRITGRDMWGVTPIDQLSCRIALKKARYDGNEFVPPSVDPSLQQQGPQGGFNWGAGSIDENSGLYIINDLRLPMLFWLIPRRVAPEYQELKSGHDPYAPQFGTPYGLERKPLVSWFGLPCLQPPWGSISAIDLRTRRLLWSRPIGTAEDLDFIGLQTHLKIPIGMPSLGGSAVTGGGLAFFGSAMDRYFRALDTRTGDILWETRMPVGATATPISYVADNGKQYVLISAGGSSYAQPKARGDYVLAYALPDRIAPPAPAGSVPTTKPAARTDRPGSIDDATPPRQSPRR